MRLYDQFVLQPDPAPILDDHDEPVVLTPEEEQRWRNYLDRFQGKRVNLSQPLSATVSNATETKEEDLPF